MSELTSNSKSPKGLFEIQKRGKKKASKKKGGRIYIHTEDHIMNELIRLSYMNEGGKQIS